MFTFAHCAKNLVVDRTSDLFYDTSALCIASSRILRSPATSAHHHRLAKLTQILVLSSVIYTKNTETRHVFLLECTLHRLRYHLQQTNPLRLRTSRFRYCISCIFIIVFISSIWICYHDNTAGTRTRDRS